MSITKLSPNWACQMGPIHCPKFLLPGSLNSSLLFSKKLILTKKSYQTTDPSQIMSFLSKLTELIVLVRLNDHFFSNALLNSHQSGSTRHHSTETLHVSLYNKLVSAVSRHPVSCFCLLDISAAFDTIDRSILLHEFPLGSHVWNCSNLVLILSFH